MVAFESKQRRCRVFTVEFFFDVERLFGSDRWPLRDDWSAWTQRPSPGAQSCPRTEQSTFLGYAHGDHIEPAIARGRKLRMTWNSSHGQRTLEGAEAALIREALAALVEHCKDEIEGETDHWTYGVALFDGLEPGVQLALLAEVGHALLRETETCPELTAVNEATIAALYRYIEEAIEIEIDVQIHEVLADDPALPKAFFFWRGRVRAVFLEDGEIDELPDLRSTDSDNWLLFVELLHDRVLWDTDYEMGGLFLDTPPKSASALRKLMNVHDDYFRAIPPDPNEVELQKILTILKELCEI